MRSANWWLRLPQHHATKHFPSLVANVPLCRLEELVAFRFAHSISELEECSVHEGNPTRSHHTLIWLGTLQLFPTVSYTLLLGRENCRGEMCWCLWIHKSVHGSSPCIRFPVIFFTSPNPHIFLSLIHSSWLTFLPLTNFCLNSLSCTPLLSLPETFPPLTSCSTSPLRVYQRKWYFFCLFFRHIPPSRFHPLPSLCMYSHLHLRNEQGNAFSVGATKFNHSYHTLSGCHAERWAASRLTDKKLRRRRRKCGNNIASPIKYKVQSDILYFSSLLLMWLKKDGPFW